MTLIIGPLIGVALLIVSLMLSRQTYLASRDASQLSDEEIGHLVSGVVDKAVSLDGVDKGDHRVTRHYHDEDGVAFTVVSGCPTETEGECYSVNECDYASAWVRAQVPKMDAAFADTPHQFSTAFDEIDFLGDDYAALENAATAIETLMHDFRLPVGNLDNSGIYMITPTVYVGPSQSRLSWPTTTSSEIDLSYPNDSSASDAPAIRRVLVQDYVDQIRSGYREDPTVPESVLSATPWRDVPIAYQNTTLLTLRYDPVHQIYTTSEWFVVGSGYPFLAIEDAVHLLGGNLERKPDQTTWTIGGTTWQASQLPNEDTPQVTRSNVEIPLTGVVGRDCYNFSQADVEAMLGVTITISGTTGTATR